MSYVDGFVVPISKGKVKAYIKMAKEAEKFFRKNGAKICVEALGDDLKNAFGVSFRKLAKLKKNETVFFSFIMYKSKAHRDRVNKLCQKEFAEACTQGNIPFDMKRMAYGGFKVVVGK